MEIQWQKETGCMLCTSVLFMENYATPQGKNYSYYVLLTDRPGGGIYCRYSSLMHARSENPSAHFKGFYSFEEAINNLWHTYKDDPQQHFFIEEEPREGPMIEQLQTQIRAMTEQVADLMQQIHELKEEQRILEEN